MIQLQADHYFHIGKMHLTGGKPCQDYAISQVSNGVAIAIISDGCSSGGQTDVGARVLAWTTMAAIQGHWLYNREIYPEQAISEIGSDQAEGLSSACQILGLQSDDLLATRLYIYLCSGGGIIHIQGDGVVALKYEDQRVEMYRYEWQNNMPYYPAYFGDRLSDFIAAHGNDPKAFCLREEMWRSSDNQYSLIHNINYTLGQGIRGITINLDKTIIDNHIEFVAVFSDGVTQIDGTGWQDAVIDFMGFKNFKGEFAKRRMIRGIQDLIKANKHPMDDIAYAVVRYDRGEVPVVS